MTKENFNRIMAGLEEARRHAAGEDVPGMVIHKWGARVPEMVERLARLLCRRIRVIQGFEATTVVGVPYTLDDEVENAWDLFVPEARAVFEIMREPTMAMIQAGFDAVWEPCTKAHIAQVWTAMNEEALK